MRSAHSFACLECGSCCAQSCAVGEFPAIPSFSAALIYRKNLCVKYLQGDNFRLRFNSTEFMRGHDAFVAFSTSTV